LKHSIKLKEYGGIGVLKLKIVLNSIVMLKLPIVIITAVLLLIISGKKFEKLIAENSRFFMVD
jgi:hypothetical protein